MDIRFKLNLSSVYTNKTYLLHKKTESKTNSTLNFVFFRFSLARSSGHVNPFTHLESKEAAKIGILFCSHKLNMEIYLKKSIDLNK